MRKILGFLACLLMLITAGNVLAAGYTCPTYKKYTSCKSGYYISNCPTSSSSWTGQTISSSSLKTGNSCKACPTGYTCSGGLVCPKAKTVTVTYNLNGGSGTRPASKVCTYGSACSLQSGATTSFYRAGYVFKGWSKSKTATTGSTSMTFTANTTVYAIWTACAGGTYKPGSGTMASAACSTCTGATYSEGGAATCEPCPEGYDGDTEPGKYTDKQCKMSVPAGYYVEHTSDKEPTACATGMYKGAHMVGWGGNSKCNTCPAGYDDGPGPGAGAQTDCKIKVSAGKYIATAYSTTQTTCTAGYKCPGGLVNYGSTGTRTKCTGATYSGSGASTCTSCPGSYTANTTAGKTAASQCQIRCSAGTRVATKNGSCTTSSGAWFSSATTTNYGQVSLYNFCPKGFNSSSTSASGHDASTDCTISISGGKYISANNMQARYVKLWSSGNTTNTLTHVIEIQAFASSNGTGTNLLSGKGGTRGSNLTNATNGSWSRSAYASGTTGDLDLIWDMGSVQTVGSIKFAMYTDGRTYNDVQIALSTNGTTWTTVLGPVDIITQNLTTASPHLLVVAPSQQNSCPAGTAIAARTKALLSAAGSCSACTGRTKYSPAGASSCSTVSSGYYTTGCNTSGNNCTGQTQCTGATYCASGVKNNCPSGYTANTTAGKTAASQCQISCAAGARVAERGATCTSEPGNWISQATTTNYGKVSLVYYCPSGFFAPSNTAAGHDNPNDCVISVSGGHYIPSNTMTARYIRMQSTGSSTIYVTEIQAFASNMGSGTNFLLGKGGIAGSNLTYATNNNWNPAVYASGAILIWDIGSIQTIGSIKFALTGIVSQNASEIVMYVSNDGQEWTLIMEPTIITPQYGVTQLSGELLFVAPSEELQCSAGTFAATRFKPLFNAVDKCTQCTGATYSAAGAASCTSCPAQTSGWTRATGTGWTSYMQCSQTREATDISSYCAAGQLKQVATGPSTWGTATVKVPFSATVGGYVTGSGASSSCSQCTAGYYCTGGTTARKACVIGSYSAAGASSCIACADGKTTSAAGRKSCDATCSNANDSEGEAAVKGWVDATWNTNNTVSNLCKAASCLGGENGHYLSNGNCPRCDSFANGLYPRSSNSGTTKGQDACFLYTADIPGKYIASQKATAATLCPKGTYSAGSSTKVVHYGETSSCDGCPDNTYADEQGLTACKSCLENYTTYGEKTSASSCRILCQGGSYIASPNATQCSNVGAGYWAQQAYVTQGNVGTRNMCAAGLTTIGFGSGADEADDCGRVLHIGDGKLYLRSTKKTDLALNVNIGGTTYYGNMSTEDKFMSDGIEKSLKLNVNGTIYSVYDDSADDFFGGGETGLTINPNLTATTIVPASYNEASSLSWSATLSDGTKVSGVGACDATTAENGEISSDGFSPSGTGSGCWCKINSPAQGVRYVYGTTNSSCSTKCGYFCANNMKGTSAKNITYRTNLYTTAGISVQ